LPLLNDHELELWKREIGITQAGSDLIDRIRKSEPARGTRGWVKGNVCGRYPSNKMGHTIQFESHTCELPFILSRCEFPPNDDVIEYWDQPVTLRVRYKNQKGRMITVNNTPDFFLMHPKEAGFIECKLENTLIKLAKSRPNKFVLDADGKWRCPPCEEEAAQYGLYYRIFSGAEIDRIFYRNTLFLEDFLRANAPAVAEKAKSSILRIVSGNEGLSLSNLLPLTAELGEESDSVYQLIANSILYVNLSAEALIDRERVPVYTKKEASGNILVPRFPRANFVDLQIGDTLHWGDSTFEIGSLDHQDAWLIGEQHHHPKVPRKHLEQLALKGEIQQSSKSKKDSVELSWKALTEGADPEALKEAKHRYEIVMKYFRKEAVPNVPVRTIKRWAQKYRRAQVLYGNGLVGLIPRWAQRGNRSTDRLSGRVVELMRDLIKNDYETNVQPSMILVYGKLRIACGDAGEKLPSYITFVNYVNKRPRHEQDLGRMGSRAAYSSEPFYYYLDKDTPRHGDRPFEICHIDHTLLDIELIDPITGQNFGKPWLTLLTDAFTRRILVAYLVYEHPSYRTTMMVLRECVRRFGRLPQTIVTDKGPDLLGTYFECLAASFEITVKRRPKAKGRYGSVIENTFGITNKEFVYNLIGNTQLSHRDVRQVTGSHNPKNLAVWSLGPLYERICDWAYNRYDNQDHGTLKESPRSLFLRTTALTGNRNHRRIAFNEDFRLLTLPTTPKGTAKNTQNKGVKIQNEYYWHETLDERELLEKQLPVKYDPYDYTVAWVYARDKWIKCLSQEHYQLRGLTESELRIRSAERAMRETAFSRKLGERAEERARGAIADQKREAELAKELALVRAQQREDANIRRQIDGALSGLPQASNHSESTDQIVYEPGALPPSPFEISTKISTLEEYV
jgi:putative transposase